MNFLIALLLASSDAFSTSSSTFTRRPPLPSASSYHSTSPSAYRSSTSTSLSMNLFDRFSRVAKSNINNVLKTLEDPEKILNQAVEDMQVSFYRVDFMYIRVDFMYIRYAQNLFNQILMNSLCIYYYNTI